MTYIKLRKNNFNYFKVIAILYVVTKLKDLIYLVAFRLTLNLGHNILQLGNI